MNCFQQFEKEELVKEIVYNEIEAARPKEQLDGGGGDLYPMKKRPDTEVYPQLIMKFNIKRWDSRTLQNIISRVTMAADSLYESQDAQTTYVYVDVEYVSDVEYVNDEEYILTFTCW